MNIDLIDTGFNDIQFSESPQSFGDVIFIAGEKEIIRLHADGRITVAEDVKPNDAAAEFLKIVAKMFPAWIKKPEEFPWP